MVLDDPWVVGPGWALKVYIYTSFLYFPRAGAVCFRARLGPKTTELAPMGAQIDLQRWGQVYRGHGELALTPARTTG
jgi:hypothetical protein